MTNDAKHSSRNTQANIGRLSRRKRLRVRPQPHRLSQMVAAILVSASAPAFALPTGGTPVAGNVAINTPNAQTMNVVQGSNKAIVNWNGFSIGRGESVNFAQPNSSAVILNRVIGGDLSVILGRLTANGHVFLINPMGVLFGHGGQVNAQGLVASTLAISNEDFLAGRYVFSNSGGAGSVVNQGNITVGGIAALLGPQVRNDGVISARMGAVALGAGDRVTLDFNGDGLLRFSVDAAAVKANVTNAGTIDAEGGNVIMSARAAGALMDTVLNMDGVVRATSMAERNGKIVLDGGPSGVVSVTGTLDASGRTAGATGGAVSVLGDKVGLFDGTRIDASGDRGGGTVLVGGNWQGKGPEQNASSTYVGKDATISASAGTGGDGGKVVVWANDATRFFGSIDARGGTGGGNGGNVEVSGKAWLDFQGHSDTRAPSGRTGTLLLDPTDITISAAVTAGGTCAGATCFSVTDAAAGAPAAPNTANLNVTTLTTVLGTNDVTVTTASDGAAPNTGRISVNAPVEWNSANSLTLTANENIVASGANSIVNSGTGNINLNAVDVNIGSNLGTGGTLTVNVSGTASTISGIIGTGTLVKNGAGTLTLSGINTYAGGTNVSNGTLVASTSASALGSGTVTVGGGNTLELTNITIANNVTLADTATLRSTGASAGVSGILTLPSTNDDVATLDVTSGTLSLTGQVTGGQNGAQRTILSKSGGGTAVLAPAGDDSDYLGRTTVTDGTLRVTRANSLGSSADGFNSGTIVNSGATLEISGVAIGAENLTLNGTGVGTNGALIGTGTASLAGPVLLATASSIGGAGTLTLSGVVSDTGTVALTKVGGGTLILSGNNTIDGAINVNAGTLTASSASALGTTAAGTTVAADATLEINNVDIGTEALSLAGIGVGGIGALVGTGAGAIAGGAITLTANARMGGTGTLALNGAIDGAFALGKSGAGTVVLGGLNTYGGDTNVNQGTLSTAGNERIPNASAVTILNGATLNLGGDETIDSITGAAGSTLTLGGAFTTGGTALASDIGGAGSLTKVGAGTLTLSGTNTYAGVTNVNAGTLTASSTSALGTTAAGTTVASGATLEINNVDIGTEALSLAGTGVGGNGALIGTGAGAIAGGAITLTADTTVGGAGTLALNGAIGGAFALTKIGAGTVVLGGGNGYTGLTTVSNGTLRASNTSALGTTAAGTTVASGATLEINNVDIGTEALSLAGAGFGGVGALTGSGAGAIAGGAITLTADTTVGGAGTLALNGAIGGAFALTKIGAGTVVLGGGNGYTGITTVSNGTLRASNTSALGTTAAGTTVASGATLEINNVDIGTEALSLAGAGFGGVGALTGSGAGAIAGGAITLTANARMGGTGTLALNGAIDGAFALGKSGTGTVVLGGLNTYSGGTNVNQGVLSVDADARLGNAAGGITFAGGTLAVTTGFTTVRPITLSGAGTLDVAAGGTLTHNAMIGGTGPLNKAGNGVLVLQGANIYTGATTVNAGILNASNASALGTTAAGTSVASGATLEINNVDIGTEALSLAGTGVGGNGALVGTGAGAIAGGATTLTADTTVGGTGTLALNGAIGGAFALTKTGAGTVVLAGPNTYSGGTTINQGVLSVSADNRLGNAAGGITFGGGTLAVTAGFTTTRPITLGGAGTLDVVTGETLTHNAAIGGSGPLNKAGNGTLDLQGANTYSGATNVNAGTLQASNASALGTTGGGTTVAGGATLAINNVDIGTEALFVAGAGFGGVGALTGTGAGAIAGGAVTLQADTTVGGAGTLALNGAIGGAFALTKIGAGTVVLGGGNGYTGLTTVSNGTLRASNASALGTTAAGTSVASGATLEINNVDIGTEALFVAGAGSGGVGALTGTGAGAIAGGAITLTADTTVGGAGTLALNGAIDGAFALTKIGAGTVILSGNNTYTGATNVNAGTLTASSASALGTTAAGTTVQNTATLAILGGTTLDAETITINGPGVAAAGALIALPGTGDAVLTAPVLVATNSSIGGSGVLVLNAALDTTPANDVTKVGTGVLRLTQPSIGSGNLILSQGSLGIVNATSLLANTVIETGTGIDLFNLNVDNTRNFELRGGTLTGSGSSSIAGNVVLSGATPGFIGTPSPTVTTDMLTINGLVSGTQGFRKIGGGTLVLANAVNTYSGRTVLEQGTLRISADRQLGTVPSPAAVNIEFSGGTLETTAGFALDQNRSIQVNPAGGTIDVDAGTGLTYNGAFSGAGTLNKADTGTLQLGGSYTAGSLAVNAGTVIVTNANALPPAPGTTTVNASTVLDLSSTALANTRNITLNGGTLTGTGLSSAAGAITLAVDSNVGGAGTLTLSGSVGGGGGLTKIDAGTLVLSGNNNYAGATNVNAGTLRATNNANVLGTIGAGTTVAGGATLAINNLALAPAEGITLNGGTLTSEGATSSVGNVTLDANSTIGGVGNFTIGSVTGGTNQLDLNSISGTVTFTGPVATGPLNIGMAAGSAVFNGNVTAGSISTAPTPVAVTFNGASNAIGGAGSFLSSGLLTFGDSAADTTTFTGDVTHTGAATTVNGTLGGANITLRPGAAPSTITVAGTINGTGTTTLGTFTLGANSTITGATGVIVDTGQINGGGRTLTVSSSGGSVDLGKPIGGGSTLTGLTVSSIGTTVLPSGTVTGNANVVSGGDITQSGPLTVTGSSTIGSNAGTATLTQASNSLHGAGGTLTLAGNASSVANAGNTTLVLAGSGSHAVSAGNNLTVSGAAGSLATNSNGLIFGATTLSGNLTSNAIAPVTQTGALSVGGAATIATAPTSNITLTNAANTFTGPVSLSGNQLAVRAAGNLVIGNWTSSNTNTINTTLAAAADTSATTESAKAAMSFEATGTIIQSAGALLNLASNKSIVIKAGDNVGGLTEATGIKFPTTVDFDVRNLIVFASIPSTKTARLYGRISAVDPTVFAVTPSTASTLGEILYNEGLTIPTAVSNVAGEVVGGVTSQIASQVESAFKPGRIDQVINNAFTPDLSVSPPPVFNRILGAREPVVEGAAPEDEAKKPKPR